MKKPLKAIIRPIQLFIRSESTGGIILFICAFGAIVWANSPAAESYHHLWENSFYIGVGDYVIDKSLHHWINDGLMAMFFFIVGLELKREIMGGELSNIRNAILPLAAAAGGMVFPALLFLYFNPEAPGNAGWGVPMATDIAFALGVLTLLGKRIPLTLKIFLTALAIADDLGAVLVIAFFYTSNIYVENLAFGLFFILMLTGANYMGIRNTWFYGLVGVAGVWLAFLMSGVHATIAGVLAAFTIPARPKMNELEFTNQLTSSAAEFASIPPNNITLLEPAQMYVIDRIRKLTEAADTPLQRLEQALHGFVSYFVIPLFALANAGITFTAETMAVTPVVLGVAVGLIAGKFLGIVGISWLCVKFKIARLPAAVSWKHIIGVGFLAGIGFTMSLFIANLAFTDKALIDQAKLGIMAASLVAGITGYLVLRSSKIN